MKYFILILFFLNLFILTACEKEKSKEEQQHQSTNIQKENTEFKNDLNNEDNKDKCSKPENESKVKSLEDEGVIFTNSTGDNKINRELEHDKPQSGNDIKENNQIVLEEKLLQGPTNSKISDKNKKNRLNELFDRCKEIFKSEKYKILKSEIVHEGLPSKVALSILYLANIIDEDELECSRLIERQTFSCDPYFKEDGTICDCENCNIHQEKTRTTD